MTGNYKTFTQNPARRQARGRRKASILTTGSIFFFSFLRFYSLIFRERGREGEREDRNINVRENVIPPARDLAQNPGKCPDWEANQQPFSSQASTRSTEPQQPGLSLDSSRDKQSH